MTKNKAAGTILALSLSLVLTSCAPVARKESGTAASAGPPAPAFQGTYRPLPSSTVLIRGATILTGAGQRLESADVLVQDGRIAAIGHDLPAPADAIIVEAKGKWVTPGLIDVHSHLGVYSAPTHETNQDGNELTNPNTAQVWAEHSIWPQDPQFALALAGGVTTMQILPGSGNLFGGRGITVRSLPARTMQQMKFPGAPYSLKMACGENPIRIYGVGKQQTPASRMANVAGYRDAWIKAAEYIRKQDDYMKKIADGKEAEPPVRDLQMETLAGVLKGEILVHNHCYRADEMAIMLDVAREFGYRITAFHHAVEAYKIADLLAAGDVCAAMWPDWWGFKVEALDMVEENVAMVDAAGGCAIVHSDSALTGQHLNQEAAKALASALRAGYAVDRAHAMRWITLNAAQALGIDKETGSLEPGKRADLVVWDGDPFSVYTRTRQIYMDGALVYDRDDASRQPVSDFDLGILDAAGERP